MSEQTHATVVVVTPMAEPDRIQRIATLHRDNGQILIDVTKRLLQNAFEIGELLQEQKALSRHGEFTTWVKQNKSVLGFDVRQAQRYMLVAKNRPLLEENGIGDMQAALQLLSPVPQGEKQEKPVEFTKKEASASSESTKNDIDDVFTARDRREIISLIQVSGISEKQAQAILQHRKLKRKPVRTKPQGKALLKKKTCYLPDELEELVSRDAKKSGVSDSELMRKILKSHYGNS